MHPDLLLDHAIHRTNEARARAMRRRRMHRLPRPPGALRRALAALLVHLAARVARETGLRYRRA